MKNEIHPQTFAVTARCACGNSFSTTSTLSRIDVEICSQCHPFFTGTQKYVDTAGRIERFQQRYSATAPSVSQKKK